MKTIALKLHNDKAMAMPAYIVKNSRGLLAIHRPVLTTTGKIGTETWDISHIPSGMRLCACIDGLPEARRIAAYFLTLLDIDTVYAPTLWAAFTYANPMERLNPKVHKAMGEAVSIGRSSYHCEHDGRAHFAFKLADAKVFHGGASA